MTSEESTRVQLEQRKNQIRTGFTESLTKEGAAGAIKQVAKKQIFFILVSVLLAALPWLMIIFIAMIVIALMGPLLDLFD